jgi:hypothetical protein
MQHASNDGRATMEGEAELASKLVELTLHTG